MAAVDPIRLALQPFAGRLHQTLVALDFDGVLAPIVDRPAQAVALPGTVDVLTSIATVAKVAIVTGRPAGEAVRLGALADVPGLVVLGHYGLQRWEGGQVDNPKKSLGIDLARVQALKLARTRPGVEVEDKGYSVALHTRQAADPIGSLAELRPHVAAIAVQSDLDVAPGRMVLELRPTGSDKGTAIRALAAETGATAVLYAGDDLGDLPAVAVIHELRANGLVGLAVCSDSAETPSSLREAADLVVMGPAGVQRVLQELVALSKEVP
jgi:trehalose 6-phosphate phosphatase